MWRKIELDYFDRSFLMNDGIFVRPDEISVEDRSRIIGYSLGQRRVISTNHSDLLAWSKIIKDVLIPKKIPTNDMNGKDNTITVFRYCKENNIDLSKYYAVNYCINYSPGYRDGEWYLPSAGELILLYIKINKFKSDCYNVGIDTSFMDVNKSYPLWTSTAYSRSELWTLNSRYATYNNNVSKLLEHYSFYLLGRAIPFLMI